MTEPGRFDYRLAAAGREAEEDIDEQGGADDASRRDVAVMTEALGDPALWVHREVLHSCWGRKAR